MIRSPRGLALALVFALASLARAQDTKDGWKWDPKKKHKPAAGQKSVDEGELREEKHISASVGRKIVGKEDESTIIVFKYTTEILKVENDKAVEQEVKIERWSRKTVEQGDADVTLEGRTVLVKGTGEATSYEIKNDKGDAADVSPEAVKWIEETIAKKDKTPDDDPFGPESPLAPDGEWSRDPALLAKGLGFEEGMVKEKSSCKGKLTKVREENGVHVGHLDVKAVIVYAKSQKMSEGMTCEMTMSMDGSLDTDKRDAGSGEVKLVINGKNVAQTPQGKVNVKLSVERSVKRSSAPVEK